MNFVGQRSQERTHTPLTFSTSKSTKLGTANLQKQNSNRKPIPKINQNAERTAEEIIDRQVQKNMQRLLDAKPFKDKFISPAPTKNTRATPFQGSKFKGSPANNIKTRQMDHLQQSSSNTRSNKKIYLSPKIEPKFKKGQKAETDHVLSKKHKKVVELANHMTKQSELPPKQRLATVNSLSRLLSKRPSDCVDDSLDEHQLIYNTQDLRPGIVQDHEDAINQERPISSVRATIIENQHLNKNFYDKQQIGRKHRQNRSFHDHVAFYVEQNLENLIEYEDGGSVEAVRINKGIRTNMVQHSNQSSQFIVKHLNDYDKNHSNLNTSLEQRNQALFNAERGTASYQFLKETSKRNRSKEVSIQRLAEVKEHNFFGKEEKAIYTKGPSIQQTPLPTAERIQVGEVKPFSKNIQSKKNYFDNSTSKKDTKRKLTQPTKEPLRKKAETKYDKVNPPQPMLIDTDTSELLGERSADQMSIQPLKGKIKRKMLDLTTDSQQSSSKETKVYSFLSKQVNLITPPVLSTKNKDTEKLHFFQDGEVAAFRPQMIPIQKKAIPQRQITIYKRQKSSREEQAQRESQISFSKIAKNSSMIQKIEENLAQRKKTHFESFQQPSQTPEKKLDSTASLNYSQKPQNDILLRRFQKNVPVQHFSKALIHHANLQLSSNSAGSSLQQQQQMEASSKPQSFELNEEYIRNTSGEQEQKRESVQQMRKRILDQLTFQPVLEGCSCVKIELQGPRLVTATICEHAHLWMSKSYEKYNEEACLSTYNQIVQQDWSMKFQKQIQADIERTFFANPYFNRPETHLALERILLAFANIEPSVGYCQGMNFVAAAMLYHAGEVPAFFLLKNLMEKHGVAEIFRNGLPGVQKHQAAVEKLGETLLPDLFEHLENMGFIMSMVATDWIMGMFLNFIPLDINVSVCNLQHIFLDKFFSVGWKIFYQLCVSLLWYNYDAIMRLEDGMEIVGHLKQARDGCEHLKPQKSLRAISQASSEAESQRASLAHEETQQKFYQMWSEILDLATVSWDQLNEQYARRNKDFKRHNDIATKMKKKLDKMRGKKQ